MLQCFIMKISHPCILLPIIKIQTRSGEKDGDIVSFVSHIEHNGSQNTTGNKVESHERSHVNPILAQFSKHDVKSRKNSQALKFTTRHECEDFLTSVFLFSFNRDQSSLRGFQL